MLLQPSLRSCVRACMLQQAARGGPQCMIVRCMAGHSKWAKIKRSKADNDLKRANEFAKISVAITAAAKAGGTDPATNLRLQYTLDRAKQANMPRDNVQTAIKRAEGAAGDLMEQIVYEGRGPGGVAMIVESLTDNRKRTVSQLRHLFAKRGGELGATGSVAWMFETKGVCQVELPEGDEDAVDAVMEVALEAGAEDVQVDEEGNSGVAEVLCDPKDLHSVRQALVEAGHEPTSTNVDRLPNMYVDLEEDKEAQFETFLGEVEEHEDVQQVYHNAN